MKTLVIYNDIENNPKFLIEDGDVSRFNGVVVNSITEHLYMNEFLNWMYDMETGEFKNNNWSEDISIIENKQWDKVALCTFLP